MYRVGGIAVHDGQLLVEHNTTHGFCFFPGGRVEYGENAVETLARELREEVGRSLAKLTGGLIVMGPLVWAEVLWKATPRRHGLLLTSPKRILPHRSQHL